MEGYTYKLSIFAEYQFGIRDAEQQLARGCGAITAIGQDGHPIPLGRWTL